MMTSINRVGPLSTSGYLLPECLRFNPGSSCLSWVDIESGTLSELNLRTGKVVARFVAPDLSFASPLSSGDYIVAFGGVVALLSSRGIEGRSKPLLAEHRRFNDGCIDSRGRLILGAMNRERGSADNPLLLFSREQATALDNDLGLSNGVAIEPRTSALYSVDSHASVVYSRPLEPDGRYGRRTVFHAFDSAEIPDGIVFGRDGSLFVALWGAGSVAILSPQGTEVDRLVVPSAFVTSVALHPFSGDLYVSTASENREGLAGRTELGRIWSVPNVTRGAKHHGWVPFNPGKVGIRA